jgi:hypothetical protein
VAVPLLPSPNRERERRERRRKRKKRKRGLRKERAVILEREKQS